MQTRLRQQRFMWRVCRILKLLLNELINQSVEKKQPKLMLRR